MCKGGGPGVHEPTDKPAANECGHGVAEHVDTRVTACLKFLEAGGGEDLRHHYLWLVKSVMTNMAPEDLSTDTLVSIAAVLIPEHSRFLAGRQPPTGGRPPGGKVLHLVSSGSSNAAAASFGQSLSEFLH